MVKRRRTPHGNVLRRTATLSVPFIRVSSLTTCRSAANATVVFERTTAARAAGFGPRRRGMDQRTRGLVRRSAAATAG